jgi:fused signal recognition particle receptor
MPHPLFIVLGIALLGAAFVLFLKGKANRPSEIEEGSPDRLAIDPPAVEPPAAEPATAFDRFFSGLEKTRSALGGSLAGVFGSAKVDEALFTQLEEALIRADVGVKTAMSLIERLKVRAKEEGLADGKALRDALAEELKKGLMAYDSALLAAPVDGPHVILVVGVNGSGKTTTIGKLSAHFKEQGKTVLLGAGDTFRAGAIAQLKVWSDRTGSDFVAHEEGSDPAAVLFDSIKAAQARGRDVVICDTAGRLQSKKPLMDELGKVKRVVAKAQPGAPHEVLLVLDGTTGQNALSQGRLFNEVAEVTGVVVTKLDGTAKGGVVVGIVDELGVPVKFIGIGEQVDDLRPFEAGAFVDALLGA